jgi:carbonic anhydrase/acetyltransferase-like protein (isoleucine patch superfamily)
MTPPSETKPPTKPDNKSPAKPAWTHPSALIEERVVMGDDTKVWDGCHIRHGAKLGRSCIVGEKTYIAYDVVIGNYVKINACVYICADVTIDDFCMISAHTVFTNDRYPRSGNLELTGLETSAPTELTLATARARRDAGSQRDHRARRHARRLQHGRHGLRGDARRRAPHAGDREPAKPVASAPAASRCSSSASRAAGGPRRRACHRCHREYSLGRTA